MRWFLLTSISSCTSHGWCLPLSVAVGLAIAIAMATKHTSCCLRMPAGAPPGSLGLPFIGETLQVLVNFSAWLSDRTTRHGPVFVSHLFFHPAVVVMPTAENVEWLIRAEKDGRLQRIWPRALESIFGSRGLLSQASGPDRDRVRAAVEEHLCERAVLVMVSSLAALVRRRVKRWRRLSGTLERRKGRQEVELVGGESNLSGFPCSSSPRAVMPDDGAASATGGLAVAPQPYTRAFDGVPEDDGGGLSPVHRSRGAERPVAAGAPPRGSWADRLLPWRKESPQAELSFYFMEEARALMAVLIVHVVFGEDTLSSAERERLCDQVSRLVGGVTALCPVPFFGLTAMEKATAARAELTATVRSLVIKRKREVDAFRDRPVCLLDSIIGWCDAAGHVLPSDVQVDYALEQIVVALFSLPSMLNGIVFSISDPAKWAAIRDQCEEERVFDHKGIDVLRLSRATLLDRAIFESSHQTPPGRSSLRMIRQGRLRLGPYELPRGWMVMMMLQDCWGGDARINGSSGNVGEGLDSDSGRGCPWQHDGPSRGAWPSPRPVDGLAATSAGSRKRAASPGGSPRSGITEAGAPPSTVPHPSRWAIMGFGDKACPAADTAVLLVKVVCLVLLQETRLEVLPGAYTRHGMLPATHFRARVHKR